MLSVGDIEGRERGVAEVNKAKDHFLEDLTVSSTRVGTVERFGAAGGAQEGEGGWTDEDWMRKSVASERAPSHHGDEGRLGRRRSGEPLKEQRG